MVSFFQMKELNLSFPVLACNVRCKVGFKTGLLQYVVGWISNSYCAHIHIAGLTLRSTISTKKPTTNNRRLGP